jgi:hypothetical protein
MIERGQEITSAPEFAEFSHLPSASAAPFRLGEGNVIPYSWSHAAPKADHGRSAS